MTIKRIAALVLAAVPAFSLVWFSIWQYRGESYGHYDVIAFHAVCVIVAFMLTAAFSLVTFDVLDA
jgi:hypothetical protein